MAKKIMLITMGGTIAGNVSITKKAGSDEVKGAEEFAVILSEIGESVKRTMKTEIKVEHHEVDNIDSSNLFPKDHWPALTNVIKERYDDFDAFLITHGTNTMGYTAAALSFSIANSDKPIIITGSQVPSGMPGSDALMNLENALRVAVRDVEGERVKGVLAVFGSHIITGTRVKKSTEFDYDAFKSFGTASIGRIGRIIDIDRDALEKHIGYLSTGRYRTAKSAKELICENEFDMRIASLTEFPGMDESIFRTLVEQNEIKGFILRSFGAGDASERLIPAFEYLKNREIPIVITTQAPNGNSNFQVNEPGRKIKENELAIAAYDMSIESQTAKLAWLLAKKDKKDKKDNITYKQLCNSMIDDMRGEVNVRWESEM
jgi:L-asparaginase